MRYTTNLNMRPVEAERAGDAAGTFARRMARREHGARGVVGALRLDSHTGNTTHWEAFIGYRPTIAESRRGATGVTGGNARFSVYPEAD